MLLQVLFVLFLVSYLCHGAVVYMLKGDWEVIFSLISESNLLSSLQFSPEDRWLSSFYSCLIKKVKFIMQWSVWSIMLLKKKSQVANIPLNKYYKINFHILTVNDAHMNKNNKWFLKLTVIILISKGQMTKSVVIIFVWWREIDNYIFLFQSIS